MWLVKYPSVAVAAGIPVNHGVLRTGHAPFDDTSFYVRHLLLILSVILLGLLPIVEAI